MRWIVYETRCLVSGKIYVGVHRQDEDGFDGYLGSGTALKRAIKKHGVENFVRRTLEEFSVEAEAYAREAEIVTEEFCKRRDTYNVKPGGIGGWPDNTGRKTSPETREKIRAAKIGVPRSEEFRAKMREVSRGNKNCIGRVVSPETRAKISKAGLGNKRCAGRVLSAETRAKMSEARARWWANHRNNAA